MVHVTENTILFPYLLNSRYLVMKLPCVQSSPANRNFLPPYFVLKTATNLCIVRNDKQVIHGNSLGFCIETTTISRLRKILPFSGKYFLIFLSHEMFLNTRVCTGIKEMAHFMRYKTNYFPHKCLRYLIFLI